MLAASSGRAFHGANGRRSSLKGLPCKTQRRKAKVAEKPTASNDISGAVYADDELRHLVARCNPECEVVLGGSDRAGCTSFGQQQEL